MRKTRTYKFLTTASLKNINKEAGNVATKYCDARLFKFYSATVIKTECYLFKLIKSVTIEIRYV